MPGGDWGFKEQVDTGAITALTNLTLPAGEVIQTLKTREAIFSNDNCYTNIPIILGQ
jgi:hypothetical protein